MKEQILKPKKEFVQEQLNIEKLTPPLQWDGIMRAMDKYAEHYLEEKTRWKSTSEEIPFNKWLIVKNADTYAAVRMAGEIDLKFIRANFTHWKEII